jgi:hypothetical protein
VPILLMLWTAEPAHCAGLDLPDPLTRDAKGGTHLLKCLAPTVDETEAQPQHLLLPVGETLKQAGHQPLE